jgi:predicted nucleotidyltransferase
MELNLPIKYRNDIEIAKNYLKSQGCNNVYLFGSMVTGKFNDNSDIDIGVKGLPAEKFFNVYVNLDKKIETEIDLIDFDLNNDMYNMLNSIGEVIELG